MDITTDLVVQICLNSSPVSGIKLGILLCKWPGEEHNTSFLSSIKFIENCFRLLDWNFSETFRFICAGRVEDAPYTTFNVVSASVVFNISNFTI